MFCSRCNVIHSRNKDGSRKITYRCADPQSSFFTKEVTEDSCKAACPAYRKDVPETPGLMQRAWTWTKAVAAWQAQGNPVRSDEQVEAIFREFCSRCEWYDSSRQLCRGCGCGVAPDGGAVFNKIRMGTQHCPRGLW